MADSKQADVFLAKKYHKNNRVASPQARQQNIPNEPKADVFELFTIKTQSTPEHHSKSSVISSEISEERFFQASTPSKTSSKTYRDKINERFKNVKERVGKSAKKATAYRETVDRLLLDKLRRENKEIDTEVTNRKKRNAKDVDGFLLWAPEQSETSTKDDLVGKSTENLIGTDTELKTKCSLKIGDEIKKAEKEFLYVPKSRAVPVEDKIDGEPQFLEEEGLYVPSEPKISSRSLNLMEQRLSNDSNKNWFNCEGKLDFVENPVLKTSLRIPQKCCSNEYFDDARFHNSSCEQVVVVNDDLLQFQISCLKFTHHPLFSMEHVLEQRLWNIYNEYNQSLQNNTVEALAQKLKSLYSILKQKGDGNTTNSDEEDDEKINVYRRDARKLQEMFLDESKKERDRIKKILKTWKDIKKLRTRNKYSNTGIKLIIVKKRRNFEEDQIEYDQHFEEFYKEQLLKNPDVSRIELLEFYKSCVRPPGEPVLQFSLTDGNEISTDVTNPKEISRRQAVSSTKISLRITSGGVEICRTKNVALEQNFSCSFDETINIQLTNVPKYISVQILEHPKTLIKRNVAELEVKLPHRNVSLANKKFSEEFFEKHEIVECKHEGVGSGIVLDDSLQEFNTSGFLSCCLYWENPGHENDNYTYRDEILLDEIVNKNGGINLDKLTQWLDHSQPDPQDPKNSVLFEYSLDSSLASTQTYFRLNPYMEGLHFCDKKAIDENIRLTILKLRNKNEPEFDGMIVPNRVKEIALNTFHEWKRRTEGETSDFLEDDDFDDIERRRLRGRKYLKQVHIKTFQICKNTQNHLSYEDVVDEKLLNYFERYLKGVSQNFINWFKIRPAKVSLPKFQKPIQTAEEYYRDMHYQPKIVIKILSGVNIPQRIKGEVQSFVEVTVGEDKERSSTVGGENPRWNQDIYFNLTSTHSDYLNPNSLSGVIVLDLFDEFEEAILEKFGGVATKRFLGSLKIPLASICHDGVKGFFKVAVPDLLLGYKNHPQVSPRNFLKETYLNLRIFVVPNVPMITPSIEELPCGEVPYIKDHVLDWIEKYNSNFPHRKFSAFAMDTNATTRCIIRYVKPLEPPQINAEGFDVTPDQCVRYISLIPFTECNQFYQNIWLTADQLLKLMIGSVIDHAVALTCYFLALKLDVWLVLGSGLPHGNTASVLIREYDHNNMAVFSIYDVVRGEKVQLSDPYCPLQKIFCIINDINIWANIQKTENLALTRFDLNRRSDWLPLFTNQVPAPTNSAQTKIYYAPVTDVSQIELIVERKLRKKITKLRTLDVSTWNHQASNAIKHLLNSLETAKMNKKNHGDIVTKIRKEILGGFSVNGFIMNDSFVNVSSIIKRIPDLAVHLEEDSDVQFASAVYLKGYPGQVLTFWMFVASLKQIQEPSYTGQNVGET